MKRLIMSGVMVLMLIATAALAQSPGTLRVRAMGTAEVLPDAVTLEFLISNRAETSPEATQATARAFAAVSFALQAYGYRAEDIRTVRFNVRKTEKRRRKHNDPVEQVFDAGHGFRIDATDFAQIGPLVEAAVGAGATHLTRMSFTSSRQAEMEQEALRRAALDAANKAGILAAAAGSRLGRIITLQSDRTGQMNPLSDGGNEARSVPVIIHPGPLKFTVQVNATWALAE